VSVIPRKASASWLVVLLLAAVCLDRIDRRLRARDHITLTEEDTHRSPGWGPEAYNAELSSTPGRYRQREAVRSHLDRPADAAGRTICRTYMRDNRRRGNASNRQILPLNKFKLSASYYKAVITRA